ncbi:MAG: T9SS C-terminal target domain-containing protein [Balneola sp.]|nr:MAG: T9SS C-terminal target domain-containing protein [Balneola sp.]
MKFSLFSFFLILVFIAPTNSLIAQTALWTGAVDSSWHNADNWSTNEVPGSSSKVVLKGNTTPYPVITTNVTVESIEINQWYSNPGDKIKIRNNATLSISDDLRINSAGSIEVINGHVEMTGSSDNSPSFTMNSVNTEINITEGSFTIGSESQEIKTEIVGKFNVGNGSLTVNGEFSISSGDTINAQSGTVIINGNATINGVYNGDDAETSFYGSVDVKSGGVINLNTGTIDFYEDTYIGNSGNVNFGYGLVNIMSDVSVSAGGYFNVEDAVVNIVGDADFNANGHLTINTGTINIDGSASLTNGGSFELNEGDLKIGGDASFTSGGKVDAGTATITLEGDFNIQNSNNFDANNSTVVFSGDSTQTINSDSDITFYNVEVDSGSVLSTDGDDENTIIIEGYLLIDEEANVTIEEDDQLDVLGEISGGGNENISSSSPYAMSASAPSLNSVLITFSKGMEQSSVENTGNYDIDGGITILSASLDVSGDSTEVTLTVSTLTEDVEYQITMNDLFSNDGGEISEDHAKNFTKVGSTTFYSITDGNWDSNSTWSTTGHSGIAASSNPGNTTDATIVIGNGHTVTLVSSANLEDQMSVTVSGATFSIETGGVLTMGSETITGSGTFQVIDGTVEIGSTEGINSSGDSGNIQTTTRIFSNSGSYSYNGYTSQIVGNGLPSEVENLIIDNADGVYLNADLEVKGTLSLTNGSFTIEYGTNLIANSKTITSGDLIMRHQITGSNGSRLLSSPIASDYDDFLDSIVTQGYSGAFYSTGSNPGDTLMPNVLYYDESYPGTDNQRWRAPESASTDLTEGRGLFTYIFGDISADSRYNNTFPITLEVQGQEHEGPIDFNVTYTTTADSGWNLVGNPYAATIDWDDANWTKTNIDATIYIWDYATSEYKTWNGTTGDLGSGLIAPFQGFWIKANDTSPSLIVEEDAKSTGGTYVGKANPEEASSHPMFSLTLSDDHLKTSAHFMFSESAMMGKDKDDAYQLLPMSGVGTYLELSSITYEGNKYAINNLPRDFGVPIEIPLSVNAFTQGFSISKALNFEVSSMENIPSGWRIFLFDSETGTETELFEKSIYPFNFSGAYGKVAPNYNTKSKPILTSTASTDMSRFSLIIEPGEDAKDMPSSLELFQNYPNPFNPTTNLEFSLPIQNEVSLTIYDMLGREVATILNKEELNAGTHTFKWDASELSSGVYIYRLITRENVYVKKMTLIK